jgi:hypothetical protein
MKHILEKISKSSNFQKTLSYFKGKNVDSNKSYCLIDPKFGEAHNLLSVLCLGHLIRRELGVNLSYIKYERGEEVVFKPAFDTLGAESITYGDVLYKLGLRIKGFFLYYLYLLWFVLTKTSVENITIKGVLIGDLLIDSTIRSNKEVYSVTSYTKQLKNTLRNVIKHYLACEKILLSKPHSYLLVCEKFGVLDGVLTRIAAKHDIKVISEQFNHLKICENLSDLMRSDFDVEESLIEFVTRNEMDLVDRFIQNRIKGNSTNFDVKSAYGNKKAYTRHELVERLELNEKLPIVVIMPHIFSDAPHSHEFMLYNDYYEWLYETLTIAKGLHAKQNWLVKPHPSSKAYGEEGVIEKMLKNEFPNIFLVPSDISTLAVLQIADSAITVRGTAAVEAVLFDIKPILAGQSPYSHLGFTINCKTKTEYKETLSNISFKDKVNEEVKDKAKVALYILNVLGRRRSEIVQYKLLSGLPEKVVLDYEEDAYNRSATFLAANPIDADPYVREVVKMFQEGYKILPYLGNGSKDYSSLH